MRKSLYCRYSYTIYDNFLVNLLCTSLGIFLAPYSDFFIPGEEAVEYSTAGALKKLFKKSYVLEFAPHGRLSVIKAIFFLLHLALEFAICQAVL